MQSLQTSTGETVATAQQISYNAEMRGWECDIDGVAMLFSDADGSGYVVCDVAEVSTPQEPAQ